MSCCLSTSPRGRVFESGLVRDVVGPSEEGEMLEGPWGYLVHPLPPGQPTTGMSTQHAPSGLVPGEKPLYFLLSLTLLSPLCAKYLT